MLTKIKSINQLNLKIMKTGIELISEERARQIVGEGYDQNHDSGYKKEELARAAICYALPNSIRNEFLFYRAGKIINEKLWPWQYAYWKPTPENRIKELAKAGALIVAQIDLINSKQ